MDALTHGFQLEGLLVAPLTGELSGPGGVVRLDPKVMDVLVLMATQPRQVILREELVTRLWGHAVVTDDAVTRCFYELRRHLAHAGGNESYRDLIETLPKRGYRLNAMVVPGLPAHTTSATIAEPEPPLPVLEKPKRTWAAVAAAAALVIAIGGAVIFWRSTETAEMPAPGPATHSIAVLPFLDMSEGQDQHYLADGLTEEILNHLAQATNLRVIARTSSFALRDMKLDVQEIGKRLGVDYVLEGSVRRSGDRVRITAQLIDASTNLHAWSRTYDRTLDDLFVVQDDIATSVATALQVEFSAGRGQAAGPPNFEAYEQYLLGQTNFHRRAPGDVERSIQYYRRAVEIDPRFARAWAALAGAYALRDDENTGDPQYRELQGAAARRAVELDPDLPVAQARLAQYYFRTGQRDLGREHFQRAVALDPNDPLVLGFSTTRALARGDLPAAVDIWRRLVELDPLSSMHRANLGAFLLALGRSNEALVHLRAALELSPASDDARLDLARGLVLAGESAEAASLVQQATPGLARDLVFALLVRDPRYGAAARATLSRLEVPPVDVQSAVALAEAHANNGDTETAFRVLTAARAECDRRKAEMPYLCWHLFEELNVSPFLGRLHDDPRWPRFIAPPTPVAS
jgi:TolB-like protein/DNA-binding winged helix-turn-helix (wHTH) protein/Tfp pilus assembly protein PilF